MSTDRLLNEYKELKNKKPLGAFGGPKNINNLYDWEVTIPGPVNSPYEGGKFKVEVSFPSDYPNSPPKCKFITKVFHPNINFENGSICVNFLNKETMMRKLKKKKLILINIIYAQLYSDYMHSLGNLIKILR